MSGVLRSLATGFDRVAARPYLILPPLALDLFLWLGPRLHLGRAFETMAATLAAPAGGPSELADQVSVLQEALRTLGTQFNLFSALSSFPIGVPSLMASTMPAKTPLGQPRFWSITDPGAILGIWVGLTILGLGLAAGYHRAVSGATAPQPASDGLAVWLRVLAMAGIAYLILAVVGFASVLAGSMVSLVVPFLGPGIVFLGFTLLFWAAVYLAFTPHGLVRSGLGLARAMRESVELVRRNLFPTVVFLTTLVLISWIAGYVWELPSADSWFASLAVLGHAFVSAMLLAASYIYYAGRRATLLATAPPETPADNSTTDRRDARGA